MKDNLRILLLEDSALDACLIERELKHAGLSFQLTKIESEAELRRELANPPDLILSDHGLPVFDGFTALKIVREQYPKLPFIFVSGSNHPGMVVDMYDQGATDYVYKHDMQDLHHAVRRALDPNAEPEADFLGHVLAESGFKSPIATTPITVTIPAAPSQGHLMFCPQCRTMHNQSGKCTTPEGYFDSHGETVVVRQLCSSCDTQA